MIQRPVNTKMNIGPIDTRMQGLGVIESFGRPPQSSSSSSTAGGQKPLPTKMELGGTTTMSSVGDSMPLGTLLKPTDFDLNGTGALSSKKVSPVPPSTKAPERTPVDSGKSTRKKKKWKKPKDKPNRPLSAYNLFFAKERTEMLGDDVPTPEQEALKKRIHCKTHGKIPFAVMARQIGAKWKALDAKSKQPYEDEAAKLKLKYQAELASWKEMQCEKAEAKQAAARAAAAASQKDSADKKLASSALRNAQTNDADAPSAMAMSHAAFMAKRMSMVNMSNPMGMTPESMRFFNDFGMGGFVNGIGMGMGNDARRMSQLNIPMNGQGMMHGHPDQQLQMEQRQQQSSPIQRSVSGSPTNSHQQGGGQNSNLRRPYEQQPNFAAEASANALMMQFNDAYPNPRGLSTSSSSSSASSTSKLPPSNRHRSSANTGTSKERGPTPREQQHAAMLAERERIQHFANMRRLQQRAFMTGGFMNMNGMQM